MFYCDCRSLHRRCLHFNWPLIYPAFVFVIYCKVPYIYFLFMAQVRFNLLDQFNVFCSNISFIPSVIANIGIYKDCRLFHCHKLITTHWVSDLYPFCIILVKIMLEGPNRNVYQHRECLIGQFFAIVVNCAWRFSIPFILSLEKFLLILSQVQIHSCFLFYCWWIIITRYFFCRTRWNLEANIICWNIQGIHRPSFIFPLSCPISLLGPSSFPFNFYTESKEIQNVIPLFLGLCSGRKLPFCLTHGDDSVL